MSDYAGDLGRYFGGVTKKMPVYNPPPPSYNPISGGVPEPEDYMGVPGATPGVDNVSPTPFVPTPPASGGGGGGGVYNPPPNTTRPAVKKAETQYVNFNEESLVPTLDTELIDLYFEQINGGTLLLLNNRNFVNTGTFIYQPIINISEFVNTYDPKKLIPIQDASDTFFNNFSINLDERIPTTPTSGIRNATNVYIDSSGNIVIETKNMKVDERLEIQVLLNGTIYEDSFDLGIG